MLWTSMRWTRLRPWLAYAFLAWLCAFAACTNDTTAAEPQDLACGETAELSSETPLPADVDAVVELRCRRCHTRPTENFAPMSLMTWEDFHAPAVTVPADPVYVVADSRIRSERYPMPPVREPQLEPAEFDLLAQWLADCAPPDEAFR